MSAPQTTGSGQRFTEMRQKLGISQGEVAQRVAVSRNSWMRYENGTSKPGAEVLERIAALGVDVHWLVTGESARDSQVETSQVAVARTQREQTGAVMLQVTNAEEMIQEAMVLVPTMEAKASAGSGIVPDVDDAIAGWIAFEEAFLRSIGVNPLYARLLDIEGDSMAPALVDGNKVIVDTSISEVKVDALYAVVYGGGVMVKRLQINGDGSVSLKSDNKTAGYTDHHIPKADLHELQVVGRVRGQFRNM